MTRYTFRTEGFECDNEMAPALIEAIGGELKEATSIVGTFVTHETLPIEVHMENLKKQLLKIQPSELFGDGGYGSVVMLDSSRLYRNVWLEFYSDKRLFYVTTPNISVSTIQSALRDKNGYPKKVTCVVIPNSNLLDEELIGSMVLVNRDCNFVIGTWGIGTWGAGPSVGEEFTALKFPPPPELAGYTRSTNGYDKYPVDPLKVVTGKFKPTKLLYTKENCVIAEGQWEGKDAMAMRWHPPGEIGYPNGFGRPQWMLLPRCLWEGRAQMNATDVFTLTFKQGRLYPEKV